MQAFHPALLLGITASEAAAPSAFYLEPWGRVDGWVRGYSGAFRTSTFEAEQGPVLQRRAQDMVRIPEPAVLANSI